MLIPLSNSLYIEGILNNNTNVHILINIYRVKEYIW